MTAIGHTSVLLDEAIDALVPHTGGTYLDGTFGGGGHSRALMERVQGDATIYALDADPDAIERVKMLQATSLGRGLIPIHANFRDLAQLAKLRRLPPLNGILLDLGLSSFQLDQAERGFAFRLDGPLDMRFNPTEGISAADIINTWPEEGIAQVLWRYGDEKQSRRIARTIVDRRKRAVFRSTGDLAEVIATAVGGRRGQLIHPATRSFQALRIAVNDELGALASVLEASVDVLARSGRLVVISFHSLEDRLVKSFMARESTACICPPDTPVCVCGHTPRLRRIGKPVKPSLGEQNRNIRSRSAVMRVAERIR